MATDAFLHSHVLLIYGLDANERFSVILGSFSNYLVTKSSVPVMVARKRLRKQSTFKQAGVKQVNNLSNPARAARSLANAKID